MNAKEFNENVYIMMKEEARDEFEKICHLAGTYSLQELKGNRYFPKSTALYRYLRETKSKIEPPMFTKKPTGKLVGHFHISVPEGCYKELAQFVYRGKDFVQEKLKNIFVDCERSKLVASNGHILKVFDVAISNVSDGFDKRDVYITPAHLKLMQGEYNAFVYRNENENGNLHQTVYYMPHDDNGQLDLSRHSFIFTFANYFRGKSGYPNYLAIIPGVSQKGHITFTGDSIKALRTNKAEEEAYIIKATEGMDKVSVERTDLYGEEIYETFELSLTTAAAATFYVALKCSNVYACTRGWDGNLWAHSAFCEVLFDCEGCEEVLLMPCDIHRDDLAKYDFPMNKSRLYLGIKGSEVNKVEAAEKTLANQKPTECKQVSWEVQTKRFHRNYLRKFRIAI